MQMNLATKLDDMHRTITSLIKELEAINWYNQRVYICKNKELKNTYS